MDNQYNNQPNQNNEPVPVAPPDPTSAPSPEQLQSPVPEATVPVESGPSPQFAPIPSSVQPQQYYQPSLGVVPQPQVLPKKGISGGLLAGIIAGVVGLFAIIAGIVLVLLLSGPSVKDYEEALARVEAIIEIDEAIADSMRADGSASQLSDNVTRLEDSANELAKSGLPAIDKDKNYYADLSADMSSYAYTMRGVSDYYERSEGLEKSHCGSDNMSAASDTKDLSSKLKECIAAIEKVYDNTFNPEMKKYFGDLRRGFESMLATVDSMSALSDPMGADYAAYGVLTDQLARASNDMTDSEEKYHAYLEESMTKYNPSEEAKKVRDILNKQIDSMK